MVRGIQRHERFQIACGREFSKVGDFQSSNKKVSKAMVTELARLTAGIDPFTPVYVFKELAVNRVTKQSRRADLVFYVPGSFIIYVEYKTTEVQQKCSHETQLRETQENIIRNLSFRLSLIPPEAKSNNYLQVVTILVLRRFKSFKKQDDLILCYPKQTNRVRDTVKCDDMISLLGHMGTRISPRMSRFL